ncbi:SUMO-activating enzyme subunit 1 [Porphyridium purpureum]|uniref:SUMO-activating enzyme subunit 1 n=1 Tax=Porphyridium purpureum TaxID=35688 RepID=A0A5J4YP98_PORPP|nr:SUMO-activating enzyme subunit 1 [Porphyridium purpureum]|eukprot:POR4299..scf222_8
MEHEPGADEVYDRQIRLWGVEAQRAITGARVLLIADMGESLAQEVAKNLVLAGVGTLLLCTHGVDAQAATRCRGVFGDDVMSFVANMCDMNPLVKHVHSVVLDDYFVNNDCELGAEHPPSVSALYHYDRAGANEPVAPNVVCRVGLLFDLVALKLARYCRMTGVAYMGGMSFGPFGCFLTDAGENRVYSIEKRELFKGAEEKIFTVEEAASFQAFSACRDARWETAPRRSLAAFFVVQALEAFEKEHGRLPSSIDAQHSGDLESFRMMAKQLAQQQGLDDKRVPWDTLDECSRSAATSMPLVSAILGGAWAREIIKLVTGQDKPINNFYFFNAKLVHACVETIRD